MNNRLLTQEVTQKGKNLSIIVAKTYKSMGELPTACFMLKLEYFYNLI